MNEKVLENKKAVIAEITDKIQKAESVVVFEYQGLSVSEFETLRNQLREENVDTKVYKNRLAKLAFDQTGFSDINAEMVGPNVMAFSNEDAVAAARIIAKFAKDYDQVKMKTGIIDGEIVGIDTLSQLAALPSRDGLYSMLLSCLQAPIRDTAMVIDAVAKQKEENEAN